MTKEFHLPNVMHKEFRGLRMAAIKNTVNALANLAGIKIADDELEEVTNRFISLMKEMDRLKDLDLSDIQPLTIFPEQSET